MGEKLKLLFGRRKQAVWGITIALSAAVFVAGLFLAGFFDRLESISFDQRTVMFRSDKQAHPDVAVILIDEASLKYMNPRVGRWPWPRSVYGDLMDFLMLGGARAVVFDILFTESEVAGSANQNDRRLIEATGKNNHVYHAFQILEDHADEAGRVRLGEPLPADFKERFARSGHGFLPSRNNIYYLPQAPMYRAARGMGIVEFSADPDGVYRRTGLLREYQGDLYPVLPVAPLLDVLETREIRRDAHRMYFDKLAMPISSDGTYLINMYGRYDPYSISGVFLSIEQLKRGDANRLLVNPEEFKNKIVFIGASAAGVEDLKMTSIGQGVPGVMLHASIVGNILARDFLEKVRPAITIVLIFAFAVLTGLGILVLPQVYQKVVFPLALLVAYVAWVMLRFKFNVVYDLAAPTASIALSWLATFGYLAVTEGKDKKRVRNMLAQYVSPNILAEVVDKYEDYLRAEVGSKEHISILFSDIRGFTEVSENLPPEKVVEILNFYFGVMSDVIFKYEGTLDKFIGDAIMAFWGAPVRTADHAQRAVSAALEMHERLVEVNARLATEGAPAIRMGIGINTGDVILGNIGSEKKLDYTAIGDNVNLGSRLEGLTKEYDCPLLISEACYRAVADVIPCAVVDQVRVKGKQRPVRIYRPLAGIHAPAEIRAAAIKLAQESERAFDRYLSRDWAAALTAYGRLPNDRVREIFLTRCRSYMKTAPALEWDGVYVMTAK